MGIYNRYSQEEDNVIIKYYPSVPDLDLLSLLPGRNISSITVRAHILKIRKNKSKYKYRGHWSGTVISHLTEAEKGYLAGIVDGEGCLGVCKKKGWKGSYYYNFIVTVANTDKKLVDWLQTKLGGYIRSYPAKGERRPWWIWSMEDGLAKIMVFCQEIMPYLVIKQEQALILTTDIRLLSREDQQKLYEYSRSLKRAIAA